jgi:SSS family solute:Na+ symporter
VAAVGTLVLRAARAPAGADATHPGDYHFEAGDPGVGPLPVSAGQEAPA